MPPSLNHPARELGSKRASLGASMYLNRAPRLQLVPLDSPRTFLGILEPLLKMGFELVGVDLDLRIRGFIFDKETLMLITPLSPTLV